MKCKQCNNELPAASHPLKKYCDDCAYNKVKDRSRTRYHTNQGMLRRDILIKRETVKLLEYGCYDLSSLVRKLLDDFINGKQELHQGKEFRVQDNSTS